jgi:putative CocE/NonD family hydrolase
LAWLGPFRLARRARDRLGASTWRVDMARQHGKEGASARRADIDLPQVNHLSDKRTRAIAGLAAGLAGLAITGLAAARRRLIGRALRLRSPTHRVRAQRGVRVTVDEGITLATDVYHPVGAAPGPTVLVRTPYGRRGWSGALAVSLARRFAERGYRVVCQDVRGRFDSDGGPFAPYVHEAGDAVATAEWITAQEWSDGQIATWGPSYLGYTQWALATAEGPHPAAMVPITTAANPTGSGAEGGMGLDTTLRWILTIDAMENTELPLRTRLSRIISPRVQRRLLSPGFTEVPLATADHAVLGRSSEVWRLWVEHARSDDELWRRINLSDRVGRGEAAVAAVTGWFDLFLTRQLEDHAALVAAGRDPHLTIGPWHHLDPRMQLEGLRLGVDWFDEHLRVRRGRGGRRGGERAPVRIWVTGADEWRDLDAWPPPSRTSTWWLGPGGGLRDTPGALGAPTRYRYDPADPTPGVGGALLSTTAGSVDNRPLESRPDVVTFTSAALSEPLEVVGAACARLHISASGPHLDLVVRLCAVHPGGRSMNLADGHVRLSPEGGGPAEDLVVPVDIPLSALAHRFAAGVRLRLQVASGAHPRIARNLGTEESPVHGTRMVAVDVAVHHDASHPSSLELPAIPAAAD